MVAQNPKKWRVVVNNIDRVDLSIDLELHSDRLRRGIFGMLTESVTWAIARPGSWRLKLRNCPGYPERTIC
jgi:hypothetical protein